MAKRVFDIEKYAQKAREAAAEGIVMLKNDRGALPLKDGAKISIFGRIQFDYYKSGTGSGGLVNTSYVVGILDALEQYGKYEINEDLKKMYQEWIKDHPFDKGHGWATEPWSQKEMPLTEEIVQNAREKSDIAIVIIGRTAGEDQDLKAEEGGYYLTKTEEDMIRLVCEQFEKTIVLLNVASIIDMKWVEKYDPAAVLYVWQGGQEGGNGVLDVLNGTHSPSGKLTDTIARDLDDYPSTPYFGDAKRNIYVEDIYVGYRYFETFARDKVLYPFGYGLSYTTFSIHVDQFAVSEEAVSVQVTVTNTGEHHGKEVVQLYVEAPQGKLGKPSRSLCSFAKTKTLQPGESEKLTLTCSKETIASYDDSGKTGHKSCYVLEEGTYTFHVGNSVRHTVVAGSFKIDAVEVITQLTEALSPVTAFERMKPVIRESDEFAVGYEPVPLRTYSLKERIEKNRPEEIPYTGDQGWKLSDVADGKVSLEDFIAQLSAEDLMCLVRGEGMNSPKVTPGTAGAFGGVTEELLKFGIPIACCADGPSGIRMDVGTIAFSLPNGTSLACTFNLPLVKELFEFLALELRKNKIDMILGPGMNIHRHPLNGRNFEYFSEDPLVTGKMAAAQLKGLHEYGVTGTIKHFAANNQEYERHNVEAVVSERALREIYLKGFEIAVKEGGAYSIMSAYNPINGLWTASNYDLLTTILREEWGFEGIVMTDWWAKGNDEGEPATRQNIAAMIRSQNDLYMVTENAKENTNNDNAAEGLKTGKVTLSEFQRSAMNICRVLMKLPVFDRSRGIISDLDQELEKLVTEEEAALFAAEHLEVVDEVSLDLDTEIGANNIYHLTVKERGNYVIEFTCRSVTESPLAQIPVSFFMNKDLVKTVTITGDEREWKTEVIDLGHIYHKNFYLKIYFGQGGIEVKNCQIRLISAEN